MRHLSRRAMLGAVAGASAAATLARPAIAQGAPLKIGLMLPFSGTYAALGENNAAAFELYLSEIGGKLGGRAVTIVRLDDEADPSKAPANVNRLIGRDNVDILVGTVHSGVAMAMVQAAREKEIPLIVSNAGNDAATRSLCSPYIFRSSFTNWQPGFGSGKAVAAKGIKKAAFITWDYAGGTEAANGFRDGIRTGGGEMTELLTLPFPETNFQPLLAKLAGLGVEAVGAFFAGGGSVQFVRDYAAAGLRDKILLLGTGFLTEGVVKAQGAAAEGLLTALHYGDGLDNPKNVAFRAAFRARTGRDADVYAVHGYDAAQMLAAGLAGTKGDVSTIKAFGDAIKAARIDSPRGPFTISASHNPIMSIYLREAKGGENRVIGVAAEALADPGTGCKMAGA